jgi:hypothetical protein
MMIILMIMMMIPRSPVSLTLLTLELSGLQGGGAGGGSDILNLLGPLSGALSGVSFNLSLIRIQLRSSMAYNISQQLTFKFLH